MCAGQLSVIYDRAQMTQSMIKICNPDAFLLCLNFI